MSEDQPNFRDSIEGRLRPSFGEETGFDENGFIVGSGFRKSLREKLAESDSRRQALLASQALKSAQATKKATAERIAAEETKQAKLKLQPGIAKFIRTDARLFAETMQEAGRTPSYYKVRAASKSEGTERGSRWPWGSANAYKTPKPAWITSLEETGGKWTSVGRGNYGSWRHTCEFYNSGIALTTDGELWKFSQNDTFETFLDYEHDGSNTIGHTPSRPPLKQELVAVRATDEDLAPLYDINPLWGVEECQKPIEHFRRALLVIAGV